MRGAICTRGCPQSAPWGYRQLWAHLQGEYDLDGAVRRGIAATRQLAKRQFTWLRQWPELRWIHTDRRGRVIAGDAASKEPAARPLPALEGRGATPSDVLLNYLASGPM